LQKSKDFSNGLRNPTDKAFLIRWVFLFVGDLFKPFGLRLVRVGGMMFMLENAYPAPLSLVFMGTGRRRRYYEQLQMEH